MSDTMRCPQGHEWRPDTLRHGDSVHVELPCPVCGTRVATKPSYLQESLDSTDLLCNSPARETAISKAPTLRMDDAGPAPPMRRPEITLSSSDLEFPEIKGYSILRELGRGGMGVVYLAHQEGLDRFVALKMIIPSTETGPEELTRFRTEAATLSRVQHPNLVYLYEVGDHDGMPYIALEFVDGGNLDEKFAGKPQPADASARLTETLARAIHVAHQKGIVHRDLKPGNVLLTSDGTPKITDFGLVRRQDRGKPQTLTGVIMGTPHYMAPEQAQGNMDLIGPKTDVYALGAMLYEFLTGRPPFMAETGWDTIVQVVSEDPVPPSQLNSTIPRDLETICLKCLEKDPAKRYESAEALAEDLARFGRHEPVLARPIGVVERTMKWVRRRPAVAGMIGTAAAAAVALLALGTAYYREVQKVAEANRQRVVHLCVASGSDRLDDGDSLGSLVWFTEALEKDRHDPARAAIHRTRIAAVLRDCPLPLQILFHHGPVRLANFSHDGRLLVTASADGTAVVWDVRTGQPVGTPLQHQGGVLQASFSADDRIVLTAGEDGTARLWDAASGRARMSPLRHGKVVFIASFSPDGRTVLTVADTQEAMVWDAETGKVVGTPLRHGARIFFGAFSPDGRRIVTGGEDGTAQLWDAPTAQRASTIRHGGAVTFASFGPGDRLATTSTDGTARIWGASTGTPLTPPLHHTDVVNSAFFSPDGSRLLTTSNDDSAKLWDTATGRLAVSPLQHGSDVHRYAAFRPDGRWVATASDDNSARVWSVATGELAMARLDHNSTVHCAAFSPDGRFLATASDDSTVRIWDLGGITADSVAVSAVTPTLASTLEDQSPVIRAPRGVRLEADRVGGTNPVTGAALDLVLRHPQTSAELELQAVEFSPDGRLLATTQRGPSACVWDAKTGEPRTPLLRHGGPILNVRFSRDAARLVTSSTDNTARVWDLATGELLAPPLRHRGTVRDAAFSPDGAKVVTASNDRTARVWEARSGEPITPGLRHAQPVEEASFSEDGSQVRTRGADRVERTWTLSADARPVEALAMLVEVLAGKRISRGAYWPLEREELQTAWEQLRTRYPDTLTTRP